jgi:murein DD-endopeptidase MepM/ murein hydrolase activator NlpD
MGKLITLLVVVALVAGGAWYWAGRAEGPSIDIAQPAKVIGQSGDLAVVVEAPEGKLTALDIVLEQEGKQTPLFSLPGNEVSKMTQEGDKVRVTRPIGKRQIQSLKSGKARILVTATRPVLFGYRSAQSTASRDVDVRLVPPSIGVLSMFHYINQGGSEMVVYRVTPTDVTSGVRVGDYEYPGFPASAAGVQNADPALHVAFFALLWNQDADTQIQVFARDEVGNQSTTTFDYRIFPKKFRQSRIPVDDRFLSRVVPAILQNSTDLSVKDPSNLLESFLTINRDLRRENNAFIAAMAKQTEPKVLWEGPFKQLLNTAVEGGFADQRTYFYKDKEIDRQVHLGFDLASTSAAPVLAANNGKVLHAGWLGIYGNCVILDHGMGLQSLYAHLSSIDVEKGDTVQLGRQLGRSGTTGLAGGDHLHFTMLLGGNAITPIDWWSPKWVEDRILRKIRDAGGPEDSTAQVSQAGG